MRKQNINLKQNINWKPISDKDKITIGTLIKGYTYFLGDFHNDPKKKETEQHLGDSKLRVGVVVEAFSNKVFKIQFGNNRDKQFLEPTKSTNKIHCGFQNSNNEEIIHGTDSYCMLIQRKKIHSISKEPSFIIGDIQEIQANILAKHSPEKKAAIKNITKNLTNGLPKDQVDAIFEEQQFTNKEKNLSHEKAWEKFCLINARHKAKSCVKNEYKKIKAIQKFLDIKKLSTNEKLECEKFLTNSLKELTPPKIDKPLSQKTWNIINKKSPEEELEDEKFLANSFKKLKLRKVDKSLSQKPREIISKKDLEEELEL